MLVKERMTRPVVTVHPDMTVVEALKLMQKENIRRLPVVGKRGQLVGIVADKDLLHASPSDATSLNMWEINYLLSKLTVERVMATDVITVVEDAPLEEAARIMIDNKIGGLPVLRDGKIVGIITETDLFKIFLEMLGGREPGIRVATMVPNAPGVLAKISQAIFDAGGNIISVGTSLGDDTQTREVTLKVEGIPVERLKELIEPLVDHIVDIRESRIV